MPIGSALDKREWEELIEKVKALPEADKYGEYQDSLVKRESVIRILEEHLSSLNDSHERRI